MVEGLVVNFIARFQSYNSDYFYPLVDYGFRVTFVVSFRFLTLTSGSCYIHLHKRRIRNKPRTSISFTGPQSQMENTDRVNELRSYIVLFPCLYILVSKDDKKN